MSRGVEAFISLNAIEHNARQIQRLAPASSLLAMVKSNGYGHGIESVAKALPDVAGFGVATLDEALSLRNAGVRQSILLTQGVTNLSEMELAIDYGLSVVVHHAEQLELMSRYPQKLSCWVKLDSGMSRLGFSSSEYGDALEKAKRYDKNGLPVLMTHFANADDVNHPQSQRQVTEVRKALLKCSNPKSACNSAAILNYRDLHFDWVRPGIMLYGISPLRHCVGNSLGLIPAMELRAKLISIKKLKQGDYVGYGSEFQCQKKMTVGIVNIGYGDGYPRHAKSGTPVLIRGYSCPLIGRVSMDMLAVALPESVNFTLGDKVILWGRELPVERIATHAGTIAYELVNKLTRRVNMRYCYEERTSSLVE